MGVLRLVFDSALGQVATAGGVSAEDVRIGHSKAGEAAPTSTEEVHRSGKSVAGLYARTGTGMVGGKEVRWTWMDMDGHGWTWMDMFSFSQLYMFIVYIYTFFGFLEHFCFSAEVFEMMIFFNWSHVARGDLLHDLPIPKIDLGHHHHPK